MKLRAALHVLLLPLITLDVLGNLGLGGSWRNSISADAWRLREHAPWSWLLVWVDWAAACPVIGQTEHCRKQAEREQQYGSVWASWLASVKGA